MSPEERFFEAVEEIKRADHSISLSLKYTRTVDVIKSIIERLKDAIGFAFEALLEKAKEDGKIKEIPKLPRQKTELLQELYPNDDFLQAYIEFYFTLRKILKSDFTRSREYRRHVTMTVKLEEGKEIEITIDIITDYYNRVKELLDHVSKIIKNDTE
ncbi:hypothetical protein DRJ25_00890 [Candidatus Woesearchaeota archaeon]|nr:MAG: hypothetical protein DRJ25_00890 [Candidatus Woesearchaeota archaeon]